MAFRFEGGRSLGWFFRLPFRRWPPSGWPSGSRLPLSACTASGLPSAGWRFRLPFRRLPLGGLVLLPSASELPLSGVAFGLTASAFRHAPLRSCPRRVGSSAFRFGDCRSAGWASGSRFGVALGELVLPPSVSAFAARRVGLRAHCFRFSACTDPHRCTAEARTDGAHRHDNCFTSKHLSQHVNLPHRTP